MLRLWRSQRGEPKVLRRVRRAADARLRSVRRPRTRRRRSSAASAARPLAASSAVEAVRRGRRTPSERRLVSVLFADLVGFTSASESRDAEEVRELLSRYFDTCRRLIELLRRHGREVHRRRGDGRLGNAGRDRGRRRAGGAGGARPRRRGLGARGRGRRARAARTGGRPHRRGRGHARRERPRAWSRATSSTPRRGSSRSPSPGPSSSASRRGAPPSRRSSTRTPDSFELKGKDGQTPLWQALRVVSGARRDAQVDRPRGAVRRSRRRAPAGSRTSSTPARTSGRAHLVSVTGIAGIGKSRLAWEFYKYFDGLAADRRTGTAAAASPTARASPTGRSPTWCGCAAGSRRTRRTPRRVRSCARRSRSTSPTRRSARSSSRGWRSSSGSTEAESARPAGPLRGLAAVLRAARRGRIRRCSCSRTCSGPTRACSTSSSTCSSGRGTTRCS